MDQTFQELIDSRFGGKVSAGKHESDESDGHACALEAVSALLDKDWSDDPATLQMPDVRPMNDAGWASEAERTTHMIRLITALLPWREWSTVQRTQFATRIAGRTIREILPTMLRGIGLDDAARECEEQGTARAADSAASEARAASAANSAADSAAYSAGSAAYSTANAADRAYRAAYSAYSAASAASASEGWVAEAEKIADSTFNEARAILSTARAADSAAKAVALIVAIDIWVAEAEKIEEAN